MAGKDDHISSKPASGSDKAAEPRREGGDQARKAQEWSGSKAAKGSASHADKNNENSSAES